MGNFAVDWFYPTTSRDWIQKKDVTRLNYFGHTITFFDQLYKNRSSIHKITNIILVFFAIHIGLTLIGTLLSLHPALSLNIIVGGMHASGPWIMLPMLVMSTIPLYIKIRLKIIEDTNSPYYQKIDQMKYKISTFIVHDPQSLEDRKRIRNRYKMKLQELSLKKLNSRLN